MTSISKISLNNTEYSLEDTSARTSIGNLATVATSGSYNDLSNKPNIYHPDLLSFQWSDHLLNNVSWLRADTFSWQDGTVYEDAYNHLVSDITNASPETTHLYAWDLQNMSHKTWGTIYTKTENTPVDDVTDIYDVNGNQVSWRGPEHYYDYDYIERNSTEDVDVYILNTETIAGYTIAYYEATDGHKIVLENQEQTVNDIYNATGVAWYFILDTTNERFKLPRTKWGFVGVRDSVSKYVPESLPNIKGEWSSTVPSAYEGYCRGAISSTTNNAKGNGSGSDGIYGYLFDASSSSSTYQDNAPVQQRATQMYLYFYVGQFSQTATEQTAGITSEQLNAKVDISSLSECQVIIETYHNEGDWYRIWSDGWIEQGGIKTSTSQTNITLLKQFSDANYTVTGAITDSTYATGDNSIVIGNISSSGFTIYSVSKTRWYACGY